MDIQQTLRHQHQVASELGTSIYQFALSRSDIMDLGLELMNSDYIQESRRSSAMQMALNGTFETGLLFMGVPIVAKGVV